jgi:hypothetical protein
MNPLVELNLALILFAPWYAILAILFWVYPRTPRGWRRVAFDVGALAVAALCTTSSLHWSHAYADSAYGAMWRQVLATSVSYGVFLAVMALACFVRRRALCSSPVRVHP